MKKAFSDSTLTNENRVYQGTGGVSAGSRAQHFLPAFYDVSTGRAYRSCFADGRPAPIHLLDGLPEPLILERTDAGAVKAVKHSVTAGFLRDGQFYTRKQAAAAVA